MSWGEFVHVTACYFSAGEYPWTHEDFYANSLPQHEAPPTVDPIVQTIWESEGPRVAENNGWKPIVRTPDRMFAVSTSWGCTWTKAVIEDVINEARSMTRYIAWRNARRARGEE